MTKPQQLQPTAFSGDSPGDRLSSLSKGNRGSTVLPEVSHEGSELVVRSKEQVRYEPASLLGRGGMGEVQLVHDHDIGRSVAVKRLIAQNSPQAVARFVDEVRITGRLEHPNIVPIHDVGVNEDGALFFVMKYVEGETLASVIGKLAGGDRECHRRYSFETRLDCFAGLLRALQYAHNKGLLHRDIKPENIMVGRFGEVMLMDWGLACSLDPDSTTSEPTEGTLVGTPAYMSPEQARGEIGTLDIRSDIYSAFVVLYELLTTQPYIAPQENPLDTVQAALKRQPPAPLAAVFSSCTYQAAVPTALRHFLRRGLSPERADRFSDTTEVLGVLDRIRAGDCLVHCPTTLVQAANTRFERFMDRHPFVGFGLAALAVAACLSGLLFWISQMV